MRLPVLTQDGCFDRGPNELVCCPKAWPLSALIPALVSLASSISYTVQPRVPSVDEVSVASPNYTGTGLGG